MKSKATTLAITEKRQSILQNDQDFCITLQPAAGVSDSFNRESIGKGQFYTNENIDNKIGLSKEKSDMEINRPGSFKINSSPDSQNIQSHIKFETKFLSEDASKKSEVNM